ncbi:DUF1684 domain-containing protein [Ferrimonas senticii]|uniref:DUF1684 domain-containing protein n=1 Tax=Ferrimonas senticii TaxID=394566 RepID=UPI000426BF7B|nr:DUF1684 domain-containing protein [Ferrimonas senticii]
MEWRNQKLPFQSALGRLLAILLVAGLLASQGCAPTLTDEQQQAQQRWLKWRQDNNAAATDPERSFLNIRDAVYLDLGQQVWLDSRVNASQIGWQLANENTDLALTHQGEHAQVLWYHSQLQLRDQQSLDLNPQLFISVGELYQGKMRAFIRDRRHPLLADFQGFEFYPYNPQARVSANFTATEPAAVKLQTVQGLVNQFYRVGLVNFTWQGQQLTMPVYHSQAQPPFDHLLLLFRDQTNGDTTYGGGRELVLKLNQGLQPRVTIDFNYAVNFYCARSTFWNCPVLRDPPLTVAIDAGEQYRSVY